MYWPENVDAPADYGDINVSLTEVEQFGDYVQRTMKMRHSVNNPIFATFIIYHKPV